MKAKNLWFIVLCLAVVGLIGSAGYLIYYGKYFLAVCVGCLGLLAAFAGVKIVKEILKPDPPKVDEFTAAHTSKPSAKTTKK